MWVFGILMPVEYSTGSEMADYCPAPLQIPQGSFQKNMSTLKYLSFGHKQFFVVSRQNSKITYFRIFQKIHVILGFLLLICCFSKSIESQLSLEKKLISYLNQIKSYVNLKFSGGTVSCLYLSFSYLCFIFSFTLHPL